MKTLPRVFGKFVPRLLKVRDHRNTPGIPGVNKIGQDDVLRISVADPDPGSGIGFFRIPDLGFRIPHLYFWDLSDNFLGKKFYNSLKNWHKFFFLQTSKNNIIYNFVKISQKRYENNFFFTPLFCCCCWIRDPGYEIRDHGYEIRFPGWVKIRIQDPG